MKKRAYLGSLSAKRHLEASDEHATSPALRNKLKTQLEEVTRRLAAAFNDVHQLCLQEIEKSQQAQAQQI